MRNIRQVIVGTALMASLCSHAQTNFVIQTPITAPDHTVKICWNSETGGVYQVLSADLLTDAGAQGLRWVIRDNECAARGATGEWMDVGDAQWLPRILHPMFQPYRFYRVQKVGQATGTPPIVTQYISQSGTLLSPGTNVIQGDLDISVYATLADTNQGISSVKLFVDGQKICAADGSFSISINTSEWPNGPHEIYAVATAADNWDIGETTPANDTEADAATNGVELAVGSSSSSFCVFSNYVSQFAVTIPFFQAGQTQEVIAKFEADSYWRVSVVDSQDNPLREFDGQGSSAYAAWDGNDQNGAPLSYGYYDYIVEARPSQYGPLSLATPMSSQAPVSGTTPSGSELRAAPYRLTLAAMQFSRSNTIPENIFIPSLNPTNQSSGASGTNSGGGVPTPTLVQTSSTALSVGVDSDLSQFPPMPPMPWDDSEALSLTEPSSIKQTASLQSAGVTTMDVQSSWADGTYSTRTPTRTPGDLFFGYAGTVGIGYQGHHPKKPPTFGSAPGGVLASAPPWGHLKTASGLANNFSDNMGYAGWRTSFLLGDDNLNSLDLAPIGGPNTGTGTFATKCNFGLLVGHMTASARTDPNWYATVPYYPVYNTKQPGAYQWIATPQMDLGNGNSNSRLRWMAFFGCQSLKQRDYNDLWTKYLLPMPFNLRLILGSEDGVFIMPSFGTRLAADLNGWTTSDGSPMTIFDSWCDAAADSYNRISHTGWYLLGYPLGTRSMTAVYRDTSMGGSWKTISDTIWNSEGKDLSYDWADVTFIVRQVY